jgi:hypothetical protein
MSFDKAKSGINPVADDTRCCLLGMLRWKSQEQRQSGKAWVGSLGHGNLLCSSRNVICFAAALRYRVWVELGRWG